MPLHYFENESENRFYQLSWDSGIATVRYGLINKPALVFKIPVNAETEQRLPAVADRMKAVWEEKGYVVATNREIIEGSLAGELFTDDIRNHPLYCQFLSDTGYDLFSKGKNSRVIHFKHGLNFDGDIDLSILNFIGIKNEGIIVEGDVDISGVLEAELNMTVFGNVKAKSLYHDVSHVVIRGNLAVEQTVYGEYNDGSLKVTGNASGEVWLANDHNMYAQGKLAMKSVDVFNDEIPEWLNPELYEYEDEDEDCIEFYRSKARRFLLEGKSFLKVSAT